jgi:hypothetical protein
MAGREIPVMADPLPSDVVASLKSDPTAALAAALILAGSFPDTVAWALWVFGGHRASKDGACSSEAKANGDGPSNGTAKSDGEKKLPRRARVNGGQGSPQAAAKHDQTLLALMRANPGASVTEIIRVNGRPRNSTMASLERLEKAGLVEHAARGKWIAVDPDLLETPKPKPAGWIAPVSGKRVARHAADGRVRDELTLA